MKLTLTTYLFCIVLLFSIESLSQEADSTQAQETIVKIQNPYKKGRTKWLNENGFITKSYDWSDPAINLYLKKAVKRRTAANILGVTGGTVFLLGLCANFVGSVFHEDRVGREEYQVIKGPYFLGGAMVATSIGLSFDSIAKVNKAKKNREKKFK
ncbi:hypothetical protein [Ekhidna sp. To15]|uniref:hypothetical protein n=1 Tax=Ekhidna sp. To15 TaxID=3395267 RepID=UPI003F51C386